MSRQEEHNVNNTVNKETAESDDMLTYKEAAKLVGLKLATLYSKVSRREIPHFRLSDRLVVFSRRELKSWLASRRVEVQS